MREIGLEKKIRGGERFRAKKRQKKRFSGEKWSPKLKNTKSKKPLANRQ
jgi:hypothetical protein